MHRLPALSLREPATGRLVGEERQDHNDKAALPGAASYFFFFRAVRAMEFRTPLGQRSLSSHRALSTRSSASVCSAMCCF
jgi:hypothetical protein